MKFILVMVLCSKIATNECKPFMPKQEIFDSYKDCARYGYSHASEIMNRLEDKFIEDYQAYIVFNCKPHSSVI